MKWPRRRSRVASLTSNASQEVVAVDCKFVTGSSTSTVNDDDDQVEPGPSQLTEPAYKRGRRSLSQRSASTSCPVCGVTIRLSEAAAHFETEVLRLDDVASSRLVRRAGSSAVDRPAIEDTREQRRLQWKKVRKNRSSRLTARTGPLHLRKWPSTSAGSTSVTCPVCDIPLDHLVDDEDRTQHVDECLHSQQNNTRNGGDPDAVDIEGSSDESDATATDTGVAGFDEYEWAGQTRVRTHSSLNAVIPRSNRTGQEEDEGDLDVDGDEEAIFGEAQFSEVDLIPASNDNSTQLIREAMVTTACANNGAPAGIPSKWDTIDDLTKIDQLDPSPIDVNQIDRDDDSNDGRTSPTITANRPGSASAAAASSDLVVQCLKIRIRELEAKVAASEGSRCLVCLQPFSRPLTSIVCWHVYCQDCWLKTLSCKKLCPLCSMITSPGDLRRIYL